MSALPSIADVHRLTADAIEGDLRELAHERAQLGEPTTRVVVDAPFYPGPVLAIAHGRSSRRAMTLSPVVGWRRGGVHLLLWLDGSGEWDYADHTPPRLYGRHKPRWIDPSHEYLADTFSQLRGQFDLVTAVDFADWWGLELMPLRESTALANRLFIR